MTDLPGAQQMALYQPQQNFIQQQQQQQANLMQVTYPVKKMDNHFTHKSEFVSEPYYQLAERYKTCQSFINITHWLLRTRLNI